MWFKHRAWIPVAWLLALINLGAVWFAARPGEAWHATVHALLAAGLTLGARHLAARYRQGALNAHLQEALDQNERLQQTIDGMESQVNELAERVDFTERLLASHRQATMQEPPGPSA